MPARRKYTDPEQLERDVKAYFDHVESPENKTDYTLKNGAVLTRYRETPSMIGLAVWLDIAKPTLYTMLNGEGMEMLDDSTKKAMIDTLSRARERIEQATLDRAQSGDFQPKIAAMVLTAMGYERPQDDRAVVVKIQGANADDWSK